MKMKITTTQSIIHPPKKKNHNTTKKKEKKTLNHQKIFIHPTNYTNTHTLTNFDEILKKSVVALFLEKRKK